MRSCRFDQLTYVPILPVGLLPLGKKAGFNDAFILPDLWSIDAYREYYTSQTWDTVIIDNDVYESGECTAISDLMEIADQLTANTTNIVGFESLGDIYSTINGVLRDYREFSDDFDSKSYNLMTVLDGTPKDIKFAFDILKHYDISISLPISLSRKGYDRSSILRHMDIPEEYSGYIHALGVDNILEMLSLRAAGFKSVDASIVATAAVNKYDLTQTYMVNRTEDNPMPRVDLKQVFFEHEVASDTMINLGIVSDILSGRR